MKPRVASGRLTAAASSVLVVAGLVVAIVGQTGDSAAQGAGSSGTSCGQYSSSNGAGGNCASSYSLPDGTIFHLKSGQMMSFTLTEYGAVDIGFGCQWELGGSYAGIGGGPTNGSGYVTYTASDYTHPSWTITIVGWNTPTLAYEKFRYLCGNRGATGGWQVFYVVSDYSGTPPGIPATVGGGTTTSTTTVPRPRQTTTTQSTTTTTVSTGCPCTGCLRSPFQDQPTAPQPPRGEGGIELAGGTLHRGSARVELGPNDTRDTFFLWYVPAAADRACKDFFWYQFVKETATLQWLNSDGTAATNKNGTVRATENVTGTLARSSPFPNSTLASSESIPDVNGAPILFGQWSADDYPNYDTWMKGNTIFSNDKYGGAPNGPGQWGEGKPHTPQPVPPKEPICGAPPPQPLYDKSKGGAGRFVQLPIPGTATGTAGDLLGLEDAPNYGRTGAWEKLAYRLSYHAKLAVPFSQVQTTEAPEADPHRYKLVVTYLFRDCLYSIDKKTDVKGVVTWDPKSAKCLGYSDETYTETLEFTMQWISAGESGGWKPFPNVVTSDDGGSVTFGPWTAIATTATATGTTTTT